MFAQPGHGFEGGAPQQLRTDRTIFIPAFNQGVHFCTVGRNFEKAGKTGLLHDPYLHIRIAPRDFRREQVHGFHGGQYDPAVK